MISFFDCIHQLGIGAAADGLLTNSRPSREMSKHSKRWEQQFVLIEGADALIIKFVCPCSAETHKQSVISSMPVLFCSGGAHQRPRLIHLW